MVAPVIAAVAGKAATSYFAKAGVSALGSRLGGMAVSHGVSSVMSNKKKGPGPGLGL